MDTIMVLMQVGHEGDWSNRGLPEVVTGYDRSPSPVAAGAEWMFDTQPAPIGDQWRLLVWSDVRQGSWDVAHPDAVVTPADYRAAIAERGLGRARSQGRRSKLSVSPILRKVRAEAMELGDRVLVTTDKRNTPVPASSGPWFVADRLEDGCVAARITRLSVTSYSDKDALTFWTPIGQIDRIPPAQPVIPVDEE